MVVFQAQLFIGKAVQVNLCIEIFGSQKLLGIEGEIIFKVKIDIEIILRHYCIPTFMV